VLNAHPYEDLDAFVPAGTTDAAAVEERFALREAPPVQPPLDGKQSDLAQRMARLNVAVPFTYRQRLRREALDGETTVQAIITALIEEHFESSATIAASSPQPLQPTPVAE